jgi:hypothetical protein
VPQYRVVFDVAAVGYRNWTFPAFGLIFVALALVVLAYRRWRPAPARPLLARVWPYAYLAFAVSWVALALGLSYPRYRRVRAALDSGRFTLVEGVVTHFVPMPRQGHQMERFEVAGHSYAYSDFVVTPGFNNTQSHGGPIREGLRVRIADVDGEIARLEIAP